MARSGGVAEPVHALEAAPDGRWALTGGTLRLVSMTDASVRLLHGGDPWFAWTVCFGADSAGAVRVWETDWELAADDGRSGHSG
ncbi:hypothetical protein HTV45_11355 [Streptomyces sp. CHD11]|uniref:hypothetical protein n=1 Tax=Streptomyces sp. CHD11 TaxID=2741325 RepID=UPI001BFCC674|nr:hypothetical protein [Streptomyces sp. CHD11]MBT3151472.1 hypothetical protein [Streptomyces sp. CHD11]